MFRQMEMVELPPPVKKIVRCGEDCHNEATIIYEDEDGNQHLAFCDAHEHCVEEYDISNYRIRGE